MFFNTSGLQRNFSNTVWSSCAFNFGPQTVCKLHRNSRDLPYGLCSITALGEYDYKKGGHIVLAEMGLVMEFPPRSTILLPSAAITHGNASISANESWFSIMQYSSASLFRWIECRFKTVSGYNEALKAAALHDPEVRVQERKHVEEWLRRGPEYFSTLDKLCFGAI